jgi:hypothetical protein
MERMTLEMEEHRARYARALGIREHGSIMIYFILVDKIFINERATYLPPFNNIGVLFYITLHGSKVTAQFRGPTFLSVNREQRFTMFIEFRDGDGKVGIVCAGTGGAGCNGWTNSVILCHLFCWIKHSIVIFFKKNNVQFSQQFF